MIKCGAKVQWKWKRPLDQRKRKGNAIKSLVVYIYHHVCLAKENRIPAQYPGLLLFFRGDPVHTFRCALDARRCVY